MDIRDLDRRAGAVLGEVVMQVRPEQLWFPTPCPDWTVRGLLRHIVSENEGFAAAALNGSAPVQTWNGGRLGDNPAGAYRRSNVGVADAFADGGALDRLMEVREFGSFPRRIALTFHHLNCVIHAWDLARAIDVSYEPPPAPPDHCLALMAALRAGAVGPRGLSLVLTQVCAHSASRSLCSAGAADGRSTDGHPGSGS